MIGAVSWWKYLFGGNQCDLEKIALLTMSMLQEQAEESRHLRLKGNEEKRFPFCCKGPRLVWLTIFLRQYLFLFLNPPGRIAYQF